MKPYNKIPIALALLLSGCADNGFLQDTLPEGDDSLEIRIQGEIDQVNVTRAGDSGFADGDRIGIYAVNFSGGNPGSLCPAGNLADNVGFVYDGSKNSWTGDRPLYFRDDSTPIDIFGYYPYRDEIPDVIAMPFEVERNQTGKASSSTMSHYEKSDLLWGKTAGVAPSTRLITVSFVHALSGVRVSLVEGDGFDKGEWDGLDKSVMVTNTVRKCSFDLGSGIATPTGEYDGQGIIANPDKKDFRAVVVPQNVPAGKAVISLAVGSDSYELVKTEDMTYVPSRLHTFTIKVQKLAPKGDYQFTLVDEAIIAWENDSESHNGEAMEYVSVTVGEDSTLERALAEEGIDHQSVSNLKISGKMTPDDFSFLRERMNQVEALNLKEVKLSGASVEADGYSYSEDVIPEDACNGMKLLKHLVLPDRLKAVGKSAFRNTILSGSLIFPEGTEFIGTDSFNNWQAYTDCNSSLTGSLHLPTTLRYIGYMAFNNCDFTGELILPESLEYIGNSAFENCRNFTGELHIPGSLRYLGTAAFANMKGLTGRITIPSNITTIPCAFEGCRFSGVSLPGNAVRLNEGALRNIPLKGDLIVPSSVTRIDRQAFGNTEFSHVILPEKLEFIEDYLFQNCRNLIDTVTIPSGIESIGTGAFQGCEKLDAVVIPAKVTLIKSSAFENCFSLSYIRCDAKEPPTVDESAFHGVEKDNFTVEVPEESVDKYRNAPGWREFKRIAAYRNFIARPSKYNVLNAGGTRDFILNADAEWELVSIPSWCHLDKTSGNKKTQLRLTIDAMPHNQGNREGKIEFKLKDSAEHLTHMTIGQFDYEHEEDSYITLQKASRGNGVDLFIVGDGYDAADIASGIMLADMKQEIEYFFGVEPFTTYRDYFNVYTAVALSDDSGVEDVNHWRNTKFHTVVSNSDTRLSTDWMAALDYCAKVCTPVSSRPDPKVGVILLANTEIYEGVTYMGDSFCSVVTKSSLDYPNDARGLIQHEAGGHGFGWLGDEYMYHQAFIQKCGCLCCDHVGELENDHAHGFSLNLSLTGKYRQVPWSHLVFHPSYSDIADVYEGGYFHSRGVYRSEYNSCMNNNIPYFSTWSRQLIVQRIMKLAGEDFSLDMFYANDKRDMGRDFTSTRRAGMNPTSAKGHRGRAPIRIKNYTFGKKGGKR